MPSSSSSPRSLSSADPREGLPSELTSLEYVPALGGSLVVTASEDEANAFHGNTLWFVADGEPNSARKIATFEVAMKAEGLAILGVEKTNERTVVKLLITYDNDPHATKIPSRFQTVTSGARDALSIHHVDRLAGEKRRHIGDGRLHQSSPRFGGRPGDVRGDHAVLGLEQGDCPSGSARPRQRRPPRRRAVPRSSAWARSASTISGPRAVLIRNAVGFIFASRSRLTRPAVCGVSGQCRLITSERAKRSSSSHHFDRQARRQRPLERVVSENVHAERVGQLGGAFADPAQSDDAHRLSSQLDERRFPDREIGLVRPLAGTHGLVVKADVMAELEQQGKDVLGDRTRSIDRHVRDRNSALARGRDVDAVEAGRRHRDEAERR